MPTLKEKFFIQVRKNQTVAGSSRADFLKASGELKRSHCILLPNFLEESLLREIHQEISKAKFYNRRDKGIAYESCMRKNAVFDYLHFLLNDGPLFEWIQKLTNCGPIRCFKGRLYQMASGKGYYDSWHSDMDGQRRIGLSINLSPQIYQGGIFQIRENSSPAKILQMANTGFGNAILFQLSHSLKHCVSAVEGDFPKMAFAGWFQNSPSFLTLIKEGKGGGELAAR